MLEVATRAGVVCAVLFLAVGCSGDITVLPGHARSMRYDPQRVGGLPVTDGPSGPRPNGPPPIGAVENTDGGDIDRTALTAVSDIEDYWKQEYPKDFGGPLRPIGELVSVDQSDADGPRVCGASPDQIAFNAAYCNDDNAIFWDRSSSGLLAAAKAHFGGDIAIVGVLAHEFGHAIQFRANLPEITTTLVKEQQADCFAGVYLRWVAEGHSPRFTLNTGTGLNYLLAGELAIRDSLSSPGDLNLGLNPHGTGLDRVSALQTGFEQGAESCAAIDSDEIARRRGDLPQSLFSSMNQKSDMTIDRDVLSSLTEVLGAIFHPTQLPTITTASANCGDHRPTAYASYCPSSNTIAVDLPALQQISTPADERNQVLLQGDNTAI
jgi:predicted metalloprotease